MTQLEIIKETINYYNINNLSIEPPSDDQGNVSSCVYNSSSGKCCAFSRLVKPEHRSKLIEKQTAIHQLNLFSHDILEDKYKGYDDEFYELLQQLHDRSSFWNEKGLNELGYVFLSNKGYKLN